MNLISKRNLPGAILQALVLVLLFNFSLPAQGQEKQEKMAITNVTVIDGRGGSPLENATVLIKNGKIACVGDCEVEQHIKVIDAAGQ